MLAEVRDAKDAKKLMDLASAAEHYAHKARLGEVSIQYAHEIKTDAETLLGGFLAKAEKAKPPSGKGQRKTDRRSPNRTDGAPTLAELGLSKKESSEAQLLARLKTEAPEQYEAFHGVGDFAHTIGAPWVSTVKSISTSPWFRHDNRAKETRS